MDQTRKMPGQDRKNGEHEQIEKEGRKGQNKIWTRQEEAEKKLKKRGQIKTGKEKKDSD